MTAASILHTAVSVAEPPAAPVPVVATDAQRKALADAYGLVAVKALSATVEVSPISGGLAVDGHVIADIVQTCVVSLVPVDDHIDETFSVRFVRDASRLPRAGAEVVVDADAPDPPEMLDGPTLDVGALVEEYFALAINPYPRAPGAALLPEAEDAGGAEAESPFAVLASLAKSPRPKA